MVRGTSNKSLSNNDYSLIWSSWVAKIWWKATKSILFISFLTKFGHKIIYVFLHTIFRPTLLPVGLQISPSYSIPSSGTSVGLMILEICWGFANSGLRPPCMQKILSSIIAETGRQLKTSENTFQSLILYLLLPLANSLGVVRAGFDGLCSHKFKLNSKSSLSFFLSSPLVILKKSLTFIIESIESVDGWAFVVSSEEEEVFWVLDLVSKEEADGLQALFSSVNIISKEEIIWLRWETSVFKNSEQIIILPMDIT